MIDQPGWKKIKGWHYFKHSVFSNGYPSMVQLFFQWISKDHYGYIAIVQLFLYRNTKPPWIVQARSKHPNCCTKTAFLIPWWPGGWGPWGPTDLQHSPGLRAAAGQEVQVLVGELAVVAPGTFISRNFQVGYSHNEYVDKAGWRVNSDFHGFMFIGIYPLCHSGI